MATKRHGKHKDKKAVGIRVFCDFLWLCLILLSSVVEAHEMNTAYLELRENSEFECDVLLRIPELGSPVHLTFPDGVEKLTDPISRTIDGASLETWTIQIPNGLAGQQVGIRGLTMSDLLVRIRQEDGIEQTLRVPQGGASFVIASSPSQLKVAETYFVLGVEHILGGIDHLLFVLALLLLVKGWKKLTGTITMFTVAHSITLALATLGLVHVPGPPVEAIIALSIVFVATEIIHGRQGRAGITERAPWIVTLTFGLLHGLGFAGALSEVGLPGHAIPMALLFFNVGVEAGQLLFVAGALALIVLFKGLKIPTPGWTPWLPPYIIGSVAMFWVIERIAGF
ncbi:HupE/UreJ family protein [Pontiellaceae bacterium B12227]|nr:HupE/UreJ family protein [Pontiellaceae bacterium B12227]